MCAYIYIYIYAVSRSRIADIACTYKFRLFPLINFTRVVHTATKKHGRCKSTILSTAIRDNYSNARQKEQKNEIEIVSTETVS